MRHGQSLSHFEIKPTDRTDPDFYDMDTKTLTALSCDKEAEIVSIQGGWIMQARLKELGIAKGQKIKKVSCIGLRGPVIVLVNRAQVAIGAGMASRIRVKAKS